MMDSLTALSAPLDSFVSPTEDGEPSAGAHTMFTPIPAQGEAMRTSEKTDVIFPILVEIAKRVNLIPKDSWNPFHKSKYASLESIDRHIRPILNETDCAIVQSITPIGSELFLTTRILHKDGQYVENEVFYRHSAEGKAQDDGGSLTYSKRYGVVALLNLNFTDSDDDGNTASYTKKQAREKGYCHDKDIDANTTVAGAAYRCAICGDEIKKGEMVNFRAEGSGRRYAHPDCVMRRMDEEAAELDSKYNDSVGGK